jgi:uncharacterized membrane protein (UPF0127 family)
MKVSVNFKGKKIDLEVKNTGFIRKGIGLTFRTRNTSNLLFEFDKDVTWQGTLTSLFVFFPFLAIWLDKKNKVVDFQVIKPFIPSINQKNKFRKIIELPINQKNKDKIVRFIGIEKYNLYYRR